MISILGIVIVIGAIAGGYLMEHGKLMVLMQPAELLIIFGAAVGTVVVANPVPTLLRLVQGLAGVFKSETYSKERYLESLKMLYDRHRGGGHPPTPATPPCVRVRTRRFEMVTLTVLE
jgi:chemotaxis protein MotA